MARNHSRDEEAGQSLILLALIAVALLAFAGLALDGGYVLTQKRRAQNVADNAALAAALKLAQGEPYEAEGLTVAAHNQFPHEPPTTTVVVVNPPTTGAFAGNNAYVEVTITREVSTSFIQLVYAGPVVYTVRAVARAVPSDESPVVTGQAIVGLDKTACATISFNGSGNTHITGGGIFSNSTSPGNNCWSGSKDNVSGSVIVDAGGINMVDDWDQNAGATVSPAPTTGVQQITWPTVPDPDCDGPGMTDFGDYSLNNGSETISPGRYDSIVVNPSASVTMEAGLYCIMSDDFDISGELSGTGVHIYMGPTAGAFSTNSSATINLSAPDDGNCFVPATTSPPTPDVCDQNGLLLHVDEINTEEVRINGGASTTYIGTFFAPSAPININGGSGTSGVFNSQIIGATVQVQGNADILINYIPEQNYDAPIPPQIWLAE
jgi:hypothetical protein